MMVVEKAVLPSNERLLDYSSALPWREIEDRKQRFNQRWAELTAAQTDDRLPLDALSEALNVEVLSWFEPTDTNRANMIYARQKGYDYILGSFVDRRYRSGRPLARSIVPYNLNPSVNHTNLHETNETLPRMRALGAEVELGLVHADGGSPSEDEMQTYIRTYREMAEKRGIYPLLDREACQYQVEAHIAPSVGYENTRAALEGILTTLVRASDRTGLRTAIMSAYPTESDFKLSDDPKVQTAADLMLDVNSRFALYARRLADAQQRYHIDPGTSNHVQMFRLQGCHIHLDLAGRSEALGLLTFYTMLRSATALANAAVLKGGPFVNGTCDAELLCTREYMRHTTVTGRFLDVPLAPHLVAGDMARYAALLRSERVNAAVRALLYEDGLGEMVSVMHNPIGRIRPDLAVPKRICTLESTGMPANVSAGRMAAVLIDFELSHVLIENYFRRHGCDLGPMVDDQTLWALLGPLDYATYSAVQDASDRECTDVTLTTAAGTQMALAEFYDLKRGYMHKALADIPEITPRAIDEVYMSLSRMLQPPSGRRAQTIEDYITDPKLRSTGNWGRILRDAFIEAGGAPGEHNPGAVMRVVNRIHNALRARYLLN